MQVKSGKWMENFSILIRFSFEGNWKQSKLRTIRKHLATMPQWELGRVSQEKHIFHVEFLIIFLWNKKGIFLSRTNSRRNKCLHNNELNWMCFAIQPLQVWRVKIKSSKVSKFQYRKENKLSFTSASTEIWFHRKNSSATNELTVFIDFIVDILQLIRISSVVGYANIATEQNLSEIHNAVENVCRNGLNSVVLEINKLKIFVELKQVCFKKFQVVAVKPQPNQLCKGTQIFFRYYGQSGIANLKNFKMLEKSSYPMGNKVTSFVVDEDCFDVSVRFSPGMFTFNLVDGSVFAFDPKVINVAAVDVLVFQESPLHHFVFANYPRGCDGRKENYKVQDVKPVKIMLSANCGKLWA